MCCLRTPVPTNRQIKRKAKTFSLTDEEMQVILSRVRHHHFKDRNEYVLALVEVDQHLAMEVELDAAKQKVLRPSSHPELSRALHKVAVGGSSQPFHKR